MSGFSFGTPTTSSGGIFGQSNPVGQTQGAFNFGASTGFNFGNTAQQPATQPGAFNFSVPTTSTTTSAAPAFGNLGSIAAPNFAANPSFGGFGTTAATATSVAPTAAPSFGGFSAPANTTTSAPAFTGFGLSAPTTSVPTTAAPSFGGFGLTAASAAPAFGGLSGSVNSATPAFGGLSGSVNSAAPAFGGLSGITTSAAPAFGGLSGITTSSAPAFGGLSGTVTSAAPAFGGLSGIANSAPPAFGGLSGTTPAISAAPASSAVPAFGNLGVPPNASTVPFGGLSTVPTTTTTPSGFGGFGLKTTTSGFNFGTTAATPITTTLGSTLTAPPASLNFGTTATTAGTLGTFGTTTTTAGGLFAPKTSTVSGLFGSTATTQGSTLPLTAITAAPAPSLGLGGTDLNATQPKSSEGKQDNIKVKDIIIPAPIAETVENIKTFIKQQKSSSSDIARATIRKLANVSNEIQSFEWSLQEISNCVEKNYSQIKLLRGETSSAIQSMEMAQRTHETPVGLQFENLAPLKYFQDLVHKYESDMITFRNQIELTEKHMRSLTNPQSFSPEDLKRGLQQIHESFIALAGRLHEIHQKVEAQKEHYLNLRKYYLKDAQNVFAELETDTQDLGVSNISSGPTPFSSLTGAVAASWQNRTNSNRNLGGFGGVGSNTSQQFINPTDNIGGGIAQKPVFGVSGFGTVSGPTFNLQTPPLGAKRNKQ